MPFPEYTRVVYANNTLEEVRCQIKFPPVLSIESNTPVEFQEIIRSDFPYYNLKSTTKIPSSLPQSLAKVIEHDFTLLGSKSYEFRTEDKNWLLSLSKDSLSLATRRYERWEAFRSRFESVLTSLVKVYAPSFYNHTCLRYKNSIRRSQLGMPDKPWSDLLQPWVSGPLVKNDTADGIAAFQNRFIYVIPNELGKIEANLALGIHQPTKEVAFIVESHIFNDSKKESDNVLKILDSLNREARKFFRWCVTDELHMAMRPSDIA